MLKSWEILGERDLKYIWAGSRWVRDNISFKLGMKPGALGPRPGMVPLGYRFTPLIGKYGLAIANQGLENLVAYGIINRRHGIP